MTRGWLALSARVWLVLPVIFDPAAFVRANTWPQPVPHAPEITLWLADEVTPIWRLTEEKLGQLGLPPPFWAFAWAGGQALARHVLDHPEVVAGRRVLDLASGSGLVGIAAMKAGAALVLCADIDPLAGAAAGLNARANGVTIGTTDRDLLVGPAPDVDVILAGDVFYDRRMAQAMTDWLTFAHRAGRTVLIGDPERAYRPENGLTPLAGYDVPTTLEIEGSTIKRTRVWRM